MKDYDRPVGFAEVLALTASTALAVPPLAARALIQTEGQNVRWRDDGTAPTATTGMLLTSGSTLIYTGELSKLRFIEVAASAKLNVAFYR